MQSDGDPLFEPPRPLAMPSLDCYAVSVDIVQAEQLVVDRKDTIGTVANHFRVGVIATGQREAHSAHENIGLSANRGAQEKQDSQSKRTTQCALRSAAS
jgi:hypothetical protein